MPLNTSSGILKVAEQIAVYTTAAESAYSQALRIQHVVSSSRLRFQLIPLHKLDKLSDTDQFRLSATSLPHDVPSDPLCYTPSVGICVVCLDYTVVIITRSFLLLI